MTGTPARVLDTALESAVVGLSLWTLLYHAALVVDMPADVVWWTWCGTTAVAVAAWATLRRRWVVDGPRVHDVAAAAVAAAMAVVALFLVRPDLDDASYVVRSRAVQEWGVLAPTDVVFSGGHWPALVGQSPYLPSFEALWGMAGRALGVQAASLLYLVHVPLATFAATWAVWTLLREWRVRRPFTGLLLACVVVLTGGAVHASWGNLHLGRIWQGKVVLLAVLVPLLYAWAARWWTARRAARRATLLLVAAGSVAGVGLTPVATFVVPAVVVVAAAVGLVTGRWARAIALVAVGSTYPVAAGLVTRLVGNLPAAGAAQTSVVVVNPWERTLGTGWPAAVVAVAGLLALVGAAVPATARARGRVGPVTAGASVVAGLLVLVPPLWDLVVRVMGTDAVAWRLVWVVPVPALVALLASPARREPRQLSTVACVAVAGVLLTAGAPVWSPANGAWFAPRPAWKMPPSDLAVGRWIAQRPPEGRYLAPAWVTAAVGATSAGHRPVGSRPDYLESYQSVPGGQVPERWMLQQWVEGWAAPDTASVTRALVELDVRTVCLRPDLVGDRLPASAWRTGTHDGPLTCLVRR